MKARVTFQLIKLTLAALGLSIYFQNCTQSRFSDAKDSSQDLSKSTLVAIDLDSGDEGDASGTIEQPAGTAPEGTPGNPSGGPGNSEGGPGNSGGAPGNSEGAPGNSGGAPGNSGGAPGNSGGGSGNSDSSQLVACILVDHGKSLKLGLVTGGPLGGVHAVSHSVCVTRKGCLELVPKKFSVEGAYKRGYCQHSPKVVRLNDAELATLLMK